MEEGGFPLHSVSPDGGDGSADGGGGGGGGGGGDSGGSGDDAVVLYCPLLCLSPRAPPPCAIQIAHAPKGGRLPAGWGSRMLLVTGLGDWRENG